MDHLSHKRQHLPGGVQTYRVSHQSSQPSFSGIIHPGYPGSLRLGFLFDLQICVLQGHPHPKGRISFKSPHYSQFFICSYDSDEQITQEEPSRRWVPLFFLSSFPILTMGSNLSSRRCFASLSLETLVFYGPFLNTLKAGLPPLVAIWHSTQLFEPML